MADELFRSWIYSEFIWTSNIRIPCSIYSERTSRKRLIHGSDKTTFLIEGSFFIYRAHFIHK